MEEAKENDKTVLPHHVQQQLCDTRLPYRQGRKLTAVKVYSIATESNHLLIFGVPSLNLRQETKLLFIKFGRLLQFNISKDHPAEPFTETYHAQYERIQSARIAKRMLDTKNFYGGTLHVCYAPELETVNETRQKLMKRKHDVLYRLQKLQNEVKESLKETDVIEASISVDKGQICDKNLLNMGVINVIMTGDEVKRNKRRTNNSVTIVKKFKPCFVDQSSNAVVSDNEKLVSANDNVVAGNQKLVSSNVKRTLTDVTEIEIVDCTSVDKTTISNINEALNYKKFGEEVVFKLPTKPVNKIKFNVIKKSLVYEMFYFKTFMYIYIGTIQCVCPIKSTQIQANNEHKHEQTNMT